MAGEEAFAPEAGQRLVDGDDGDAVLGREVAMRRNPGPHGHSSAHDLPPNIGGYLLVEGHWRGGVDRHENDRLVRTLDNMRPKLITSILRRKTTFHSRKSLSPKNGQRPF